MLHGATLLLLNVLDSEFHWPDLSMVIRTLYQSTMLVVPLHLKVLMC